MSQPVEPPQMPIPGVPGAPAAPTFNPADIIAQLTVKFHENILMVYLIVFIAVATAAYALYMIWEEYKRHPIKHRPKKWGKMGKLSDMLRKK
jgi:hypothetical protein